MGYSLQIELIAGSEGAVDTGNANYGVLFDEATPQHSLESVVIGRITNLDPGVTSVTFRDLGSGAVGDTAERYGSRLCSDRNTPGSCFEIRKRFVLLCWLAAQ